MKTDYDLAIVGAGSGGIGAALAAARLGLRVILIEQAQTIGGTATLGGVHDWEGGAGGTGLPFDIYRRLKSIPDAVGLYSFGRHFCWQDQFYWPHALDRVNFPGGEQVIDPTLRYIDTLRRHRDPDTPADEQFKRRTWHGVMFEPDAYTRVVTQMLAETEHCDVRVSTSLQNVESTDGVLHSASLSDGTAVHARSWIDATGNAVLCKACGCQTYFGRDAQDRFGEPSAPKNASTSLNGVTLIYRVTPTQMPGVEPLAATMTTDCWWAECFPPTHATRYPNGDININMLPSMSGEEFVALGPSKAYSECLLRVRAHWHFLQQHWPEFQKFKLHWIAPALGVRESRRVSAKYMLREQDLLAGLSGQKHKDIIAIADHPMDRHGEGGGCIELTHPYGVPYSCLIPEDMRNLLIACRASGFSSIAASSCRLSRTMMQLGQAAGTAAAIAERENLDVADVQPDTLRACLHEQFVQLDWPMSLTLEAHLSQDV